MYMKYLMRYCINLHHATSCHQISHPKLGAVKAPGKKDPMSELLHWALD